MSRIGKKPIKIPENVNIEIKDKDLLVKGSKGELLFKLPKYINIDISDKEINVKRTSEIKLAKSIHGTTRKIIDNMIQGVSNGFEKKLEIVGVGYRASVQQNKLVLSLGFSHPVEITAPAGISFQVQKNIITISGIDKQLVGQVAANIRALRKPEPYKGKGIKYQGELIKRKAGKAAKAAGAGGA